MPVCTDGAVEFECGGRHIKVRINRVHLEEDAGKLIHLSDEPYSLVDYNRAGIPLIEIVTEPDMRSPLEAVTFMRMSNRYSNMVRYPTAVWSRARLRGAMPIFP